MKNVTVLIPTYNHGSVLAYQIESLLKQTSTPKHIIILDDGSTDNTPEILEKYQGNETVKVIRQEKNKGVHAATTRLLSQVDTEFFAFAAADDILASNWSETMASLLESYDDAKMAISNSFIFENGRVYVTDSINPLYGDLEGIYEPSQYIGLLMRYGMFPPSNTILYRSDIIEELIMPVFSRKELGSLTDVLLILAIATKYPIAYSTKPTGVCVKSSESYGNSFFSKGHLKNLTTTIENFSIRDQFIPYPKLVSFLKGYAKYSWVKQIVMNKLATNRRENSGLNYSFSLFACYFELLIAFLGYKRFRFIKFNKPTHYQAVVPDLEAAIDRSLFKRFYSA